MRATGIEFFEVPSLTSFAEPGGNNLKVDLLVPSPDDSYPTIPVPELKAHAKGLPYLAYLLGVSQEIPVLSTHGSVMVRVPVPERYALHKLIVSQLRSKTSTKPEKDLRQAATLIEVLAQVFPGAIEDASEVLPDSALGHVSRALEALTHHLPKAAGAAWDTLQPLVKRLKQATCRPLRFEFAHQFISSPFKENAHETGSMLSDLVGGEVRLMPTDSRRELVVCCALTR